MPLNVNSSSNSIYLSICTQLCYSIFLITVRMYEADWKG